MPIEDHPPHFFLDENLPKCLWKAMRAAGYNAARAIDEHLRGQPDSVVFRQLRSRSVIITRDQDFLRADLFPRPHSGILVVNVSRNTSVAEIVRIVMEALQTLKDQELTNKVYLIEGNKVRLYS